VTITDEPAPAASPVATGRRVLAWFWPYGAALSVCVALAAAAYAWKMSTDPLEPYYEASVRSMSTSAHNFLFGAVDPAGTLTLDKLPGALWVQAVFVAVFGFHTWAMVLPQVIEGALTVVFLYRAVARLGGKPAGIVAAAVLAISPAVVALNRGNMSDSLMLLLLVLAADAASAAIRSGHSRSLVLAGVWVGLAFQAKMLQAWLVLPALGLPYLVSGPGATTRRLRQLFLAGLVTVVVSLSWMSLVSLVPADQRPYVDGSANDSWFQQVFLYNGFTRLGGQTPLQAFGQQSLGLYVPVQPVSPWRLLTGSLGRDTGWLLLAAILVAVLALVGRRHQPRTDAIRAGLILWTSWLVVLGVVFSVSTSINSYYTAALAPPVAAIIGIAVGTAWPSRHRLVPIASGVVVIAAVGYAAWLLPRDLSTPPVWLRPTVIAAGVVALAAAVIAALRQRRGANAVTLAVGLVAICLTPTVAATSMVTNHAGVFDTPFEQSSAVTIIDNLFIRNPANVASTIPGVELARGGTPYLLATQSAAIGSLFIDATGEEALPIGGFTGTGPSPTLAQIQADICHGKFHLALVADGPDPRLHWIAENCDDLSPLPGGPQLYRCLPPTGCRSH
jgi:4-amino-4-deoxy-L-arabinose transferase-like glycosyltransferase